MRASDFSAAAVERFWAKVNKNGPVPAHCPELGPCWVWTGSKTTAGYGDLQIRSGPRIKIYAHRMSFILSIGEIADGQKVCHRCDNPPCVNPQHLFEGSQSDNMRDCVKKGRLKVNAKSGELHSHAKLNNASVSLIRERAAAGEPLSDLAMEFGVAKGNIAFIVHGKTWKNAGGPITEASPQIGEDNRQHKIAAGDVLEIRRVQRKWDQVTAAASRFGVSPNTILRIIDRKSWAHIP